MCTHNSPLEGAMELKFASFCSSFNALSNGILLKTMDYSKAFCESSVFNPLLLLYAHAHTHAPTSLQGVSAAPSHDESLFGWSARLEGVRGTVWEGGVFQLTLSFSDEFNTRPPSVHFVTIPFHPNGKYFIV